MDELAKAAKLHRDAELMKEQAVRNRAEVVEMLLDGTIRAVDLARELEVSQDTISQWVMRYRVKNGLPRPAAGGTHVARMTRRAKRGA